MSLVSESLKSQIELQLGKIHDTFKKTQLKVYCESEVVVASTDPDFNPIFRRPSSHVVNQPQIHTIEARISYGDVLNNDRLENSGIKLSSNEAYLKIKSEDFELFKQAKRMELNGERYSVSSEKRPIGMFSTKYYGIKLKKVD